jgi:hypothetical protein
VLLVFYFNLVTLNETPKSTEFILNLSVLMAAVCKRPIEGYCNICDCTRPGKGLLYYRFWGKHILYVNSVAISAVLGQTCMYGGPSDLFLRWVQTCWPIADVMGKYETKLHILDSF